jgi:hypothetical protein
MILWQCFGLKTVSAYDETPRIAACPDWLSLLGTVEHWDKALLAKINAEQGLVPYKTHDHPENTPDPNAPAIYVIRDGREACVSYWRYHHDLLGKRDVSLADVIRGKCMFGSWSDHVKAWEPKPFGTAVGNVCRPQRDWTYEDLKAHPAISGDRIACFLGRSFNDKCLAPWNQLHEADPAFFRSGTNDTWRELMTGDDLSLFWDLHGETMREYGYCEEACYA